MIGINISAGVAMSNNVYKKSRSYAPERFFECEGRGLNWLREAYDYGGPKVAKVFDWGKDLSLIHI